MPVEFATDTHHNPATQEMPTAALPCARPRTPSLRGPLLDVRSPSSRRRFAPGPRHRGRAGPASGYPRHEPAGIPRAPDHPLRRRSLGRDRQLQPQRHVRRRPPHVVRRDHRRPDHQHRRTRRPRSDIRCKKKRTGSPQTGAPQGVLGRQREDARHVDDRPHRRQRRRDRRRPGLPSARECSCRPRAAWEIRDAGTLNGLVVQRCPCRGVAGLHEGDVVTVGNVDLVFTCGHSSSPGQGARDGGPHRRPAGPGRQPDHRRWPHALDQRRRSRLGRAR